MNIQNQMENKKEPNPPLVKGETAEDWEKLKKYKISMGEFYTGPFATARGNPNFGLVPLITKYLFLSYALYYAITKNYKYTIYACMLYAVGCLLNGIRFYYINSLSEYGEDHTYLKTTVDDNIVGGSLAMLAIFYILYKKYSA